MDEKKNKIAKTNSGGEQKEAVTSRRMFLRKLWLLIGGLALFEYLLVAFTFFRPRSRRRAAEENVVTAGPVENFEPNSVTAYPRGRFYLARLKNGGFVALSRKCTHLGCTVAWEGNKERFICPCHASSFDITGDVLSPPAPRALDFFPVRIENGIVKVDISAALKRQRYEANQETHI